MTNQDGSTKDPYAEQKSTSECMGRWRHYFYWVWKDGKWTDYVRCQTCGYEKLMRKEDR